jgi:hypothetical protein
MERAKTIAAHFFERLDYDVSDISVSSGKRADMRVFDGMSTYIVEVKEKARSDSQIEHSTIDYDGSKVNIAREPHSRSNRLDGVLKHAAKQLAETPCNDSDFKLIWLHSDSASARMTIYRTLYTFYGVAQLVPRSQQGDGVNCAYFYTCTAFNCPVVDGLIVVEHNSLQLCLNEFSRNYESFKTSNLVRRLGEAVYDPVRFDNKPGTIVLRESISRKNDVDTLAEIERVTGVKYSVIAMNSYQFW